MSELHFEVAGAQGPKQFFSHLTAQTLAHGYLFTGPPGVGKKTFARRLAQSLLCTAPKSGVLGYDGTCASCRLIGKEETRHPDLFESTGALKIGESGDALSFHEGQATSRDLVRQLSLQSYAGGRRVFILGDVEFASPAAANALLKFFEEPPEGVVLLLTTPSPAKLIATIRSRLVEVRFPALRQSEVRDILLEKGFDEQRAGVGATIAQGSVTRALDVLLDAGEEQLRSQVARWFFDASEGRTPEETWATRETLEDGLDVAQTLARDRVALAAAGSHARLLAPDYADRVRALPAIGDAAGAELLERIEHGQRLARTNVSPALVADLVRMAITSTT